MSGKKGLYIYGGAPYYSWQRANDYGYRAPHNVEAQSMRQYAIRSLGLMDGPNSKNLAFRGRTEALTTPIAIEWSNNPPQCEKTITKGEGFCNSGHYIPNEDVRAYCVKVLGMQGLDVIEKVVEVEKLVEVERERIVEVPLDLTFDERLALENALQRSQHIANEYLRRAMVADDADEVMRISTRLQSILSVMDKLGVAPGRWLDGPEWLADTPMMHLDADGQLRLM